LDIFSRSVVGWMVAAREAASLAERPLAETITAQQVEPHQLTIHGSGHLDNVQADGAAAGRPGRDQVPLPAQGVQRQPVLGEPVKTLKHHPTFPERFGCIQDARAFCQRFFGWYNAEHRHSGFWLLTPADVHHGRAEQITLARGVVLDAAFAAHPERFVGKPPQPPRLPKQVWINKPIDPPEPPQQFPG
jgi:putative transposase